MKIAKLRHRIRIDAPTLGPPNEYGERPETWTKVCDAWAEVAPVSAKEYERARSFDTSVSHRVTVRYRPGLSPQQRIVFEGRVLNINGVIDDGGRKIETYLFATEVVQ